MQGRSNICPCVSLCLSDIRHRFLSHLWLYTPLSLTLFPTSGNPFSSKEVEFILCLQRKVTKMAKLCHKTLKGKIAEQNRTQFSPAEKLDISDRQIRNLCKKDTDVMSSLCYSLSKTFGTPPMEREFIHYCDRCGQCLSWKHYRKALIIRK